MDYSNCDTEIVKVGENHVEKRYILYTKGGAKEVVHIEDYGQARIDKETVQANNEKTRLQSLVINDAIAIQNAKLTELGLIQTEMDT
jgi:hypothetical protein